MKISVFIITLNEAKNIRSCLESIRWADEIVVVDMKSDDATSAITKEYTDKVFSFERTGYCEPARQYAYEQTTGDWILNLDADEMMTAPLRAELRRITKEDLYNAAYLPRRNYFWGEEMKHCGCGQFQDRQLRFYKKGAVNFSKTIHAGVQLNDSARAFKIDNPEACLLHFSYVSPEQYLEKMERYTTIEAKNLFDNGKAYPFKIALKDAWNAFWKRYIKKSEGYKDGPTGFVYCLWTAVYKLNVYLKYALMKTYKTSDYVPQIEKKYEQMILKTLEELKH